MRILLSSVAHFVNSGYGTQSRFLIRAFKDLGHEVFFMPHWGYKGGPARIDDVEYLPTFRDSWGHDIVGEHVKVTRADCLISFHDVWTLSRDFPRLFSVPWITYSPVDSIPTPPRLVRILKEAKHVVAMSQFGKREMRKSGIPSIYIPHAINTDIYYPRDKKAARKELGIREDKFICLIAAANFYYPSRKAFPEQMAAFAAFHKEYPDSDLLLHTALTPTTNDGGLDLNDLVRNLGLGDCTCNTPDYDIAMGLSDDRMAMMYSAADVLLGASYGEGFGLCQAEAQACGTPVIVHDFSASPEYLFAGIKVPSVQRFWNMNACWQAIPSIPAITRAIKEIYLNQDLYAEQGLQAAETVKQELSWQVVRDKYWRPFLEEVEVDINSAREFHAEPFLEVDSTEISGAAVI